MTLRVESCRWCGAPILWLRHATTGKPAPIDADETPNGNVLVDPLVGTYRVAAHPPAPGAAAQGPGRHKNHWATCRSAEAERRRSVKKRKE